MVTARSSVAHVTVAVPSPLFTADPDNLGCEGGGVDGGEPHPINRSTADNSISSFFMFPPEPPTFFGSALI